jgi:Tfp pilus assembly protein PilV
MRRNRVWSGEQGVTLIEAMIGVVIITVVALSLALFIPKTSQTITSSRAHNAAADAAASILQQYEKEPYQIVPVTPNGSYFLASPIGPCDCNNVDFNSLPSTTIVTSGAGQLVETVCTNLVKHTAVGWESTCQLQPDTGLKHVVVNMAWSVGGTTQSLTVGTLLSQRSENPHPRAPRGEIRITVCPANGNFPPSCQGPTGILGIYGHNNQSYAGIQGAEVWVDGPTYETDNAGVTNFPTPISFMVPAGAGYKISVQKVGYFPYTIYGTSVAAGDVNVIPTIVLRDIPTYGAKLTGEVYVANHPVISKVMAQVADYNPNVCVAQSPLCSDHTEALELFNPTINTYQFANTGTGNLLRLVFCNEFRCVSPDVNANPFQVNTASWPPNTYFLLVGYDTSTVNGITVSNPELGLNNPDIQYQVLSYGPEGLIPYKTAGGVQLQLSTDGGTSWSTLDSVGWNGPFNSMPATTSPQIGVYATTWVANFPKKSLVAAFCPN